MGAGENIAISASGAGACNITNMHILLLIWPADADLVSHVKNIIQVHVIYVLWQLAALLINVYLN